LQDLTELVDVAVVVGIDVGAEVMGKEVVE
jgi:hypothetical protein